MILLLFFASLSSQVVAAPVGCDLPAACDGLTHEHTIIDDRCYYVVTTAASWENAMDKAIAESASYADIVSHLAWFESESQFSAFVTYFDQKISLSDKWTGARELFDMDSRGNVWWWLDKNTPRIPVGWATDKLANGKFIPDDNDQSCMRLKSAQSSSMQDSSCTYSLGYIGQMRCKSTIPEPYQATDCNSHCAAVGGTVSGNSCYLYENHGDGNGHQKNPDVADQVCSSYAAWAVPGTLGRLAKIDTADKWSVVKALIGSNENVWIGLRGQRDDNNQLSDINTVKWKHGCAPKEDINWSTMDFVDFPITNAGSRCIAIKSAATNQWYPMACQTKSTYLCELECPSVPTARSKSNCESRCDDDCGNSAEDGHCYEYVQHQISNAPAQRYCEWTRNRLHAPGHSFGVKINSASKQEFIKNWLIDQDKPTHLTVGLRNLDGDLNWEEGDGHYEEHDPTIVTGASTNGYCYVIKNNADNYNQVETVDCHLEYEFICETVCTESTTTTSTTTTTTTTATTTSMASGTTTTTTATSATPSNPSTPSTTAAPATTSTTTNPTTSTATSSLTTTTATSTVTSNPSTTSSTAAAPFTTSTTTNPMTATTTLSPTTTTATSTATSNPSTPSTTAAPVSTSTTTNPTTATTASSLTTTTARPTTKSTTFLVSSSTQPQPVTRKPIPLTKTEKMVVEVLQTIGCTFLIISLSVTIGIYLFLTDFSIERCLHIGYELSTLCGHILVLLARDVVAHEIYCKLAGIGMHYFFLASFVFLLLESLQTYSIMTNVVSSGGYLSRKVNYLIGFVLVPVPIVGITALVLHDEYPSDFSCWVNFDGYLCAAIIGPIVILVWTTIIITEASAQKYRPRLPMASAAQYTVAQVNQKAMLLVLGASMASYFAGAFAIYYVKVYLYSTVTLLNILLGVVVFVFHTLGNPKAQKLVRNGVQKLRGK